MPLGPFTAAGRRVRQVGEEVSPPRDAERQVQRRGRLRAVDGMRPRGPLGAVPTAAVSYWHGVEVGADVPRAVTVEIVLVRLELRVGARPERGGAPLAPCAAVVPAAARWRGSRQTLVGVLRRQHAAGGRGARDGGVVGVDAHGRRAPPHRGRGGAVRSHRGRLPARVALAVTRVARPARPARGGGRGPRELLMGVGVGATAHHADDGIGAGRGDGGIGLGAVGGVLPEARRDPAVRELVVGLHGGRGHALPRRRARAFEARREMVGHAVLVAHVGCVDGHAGERLQHGVDEHPAAAARAERVDGAHVVRLLELDKALDEVRLREVGAQIVNVGGLGVRELDAALERAVISRRRGRPRAALVLLALLARPQRRDGHGPGRRRGRGGDGVGHERVWVRDVWEAHAVVELDEQVGQGQVVGVGVERLVAALRDHHPLAAAAHLRLVPHDVAVDEVVVERAEVPLQNLRDRACEPHVLAVRRGRVLRAVLRRRPCPVRLGVVADEELLQPLGRRPRRVAAGHGPPGVRERERAEPLFGRLHAQLRLETRALEQRPRDGRQMAEVGAVLESRVHAGAVEEGLPPPLFPPHLGCLRPREHRHGRLGVVPRVVDAPRREVVEDRADVVRVRLHVGVKPFEQVLQRLEERQPHERRVVEQRKYVARGDRVTMGLDLREARRRGKVHLVRDLTVRVGVRIIFRHGRRGLAPL